MLLLQDRLIAGKTPDSEELEILRAMPMHKLTHKKPIDLGEVERLIGAPKSAFEGGH